MKRETRLQHPPAVDIPVDNRPLNMPIQQNVKWTLPSVDETLRVVRGERPGFVYSRMTNPGVRQLELALAALQGRADCVTAASGISAITQLLSVLLRAGDHVVFFVEGYAPTRQFITGMLAAHGIAHTLLALDDHEGLRAALAARPTKLVLFESPTTPAGRIADVSALTRIAREHGALSVMDNTLAGFHQHGEFQVDLFVHSLTKFATGAGDVMGGAVIGDEALIKTVRSGFQQLGAPLDPVTASFMMRGLKTYLLRYRAQSAAALEVARFLEGHPACARVLHPGLDSHPQAALARAQMLDPGCVITFALRAGAEAGRRFTDALQLFACTPSYGSTESLVLPPQMLQPRDLDAAQRAMCGVGEGTVRLSIGLEDPQDLCDDLAQALAEVHQPGGLADEATPMRRG